MEFKEYRFDLMDMYGGIDRKWKVDEGGHKLIRMDGQDNEQYFYYLPDFTTPGLRAWWRGLRTFSLVVNKQEVPLNIIQRWKLFGLLEGKFSDIKRVITAKKKMVKAAKKVGAVSPLPLLKSVKSLFFDTKEEEYDDEYESINVLRRERERVKKIIDSDSFMKSPKGRLSSYVEDNRSSAAKFQEKMEAKLREQLKSQNEYDNDIKRRAEKMLKGAISKEDLFSERLEGINKKINRLDQLMRNGH